MRKTLFACRASIVVAVAMLSVSTARADDEAAPEPEPAPAPPPPPRRKVGLTGRVHGGLGERRLYDSSILGADLTAGVGAYTDSLNVYADLQLLFASSEGLPVRQVLLGPSVDFEPFSHVRFGGGLAAGGTMVTRASGRTMDAFSLGARLFASVDVWRIGERGGMYVLGQISMDTAGTLFGEKRRSDVPTSVLWGPTIAAGVRF